MRMMRWLAVRGGVGVASVAITVASMLLSGLATAAIMLAASGSVDPERLIVGLVIPLIIAPPFSIVTMRLVKELDEAHRELVRLSTLDELTGVANRRRFMERATQELARVRRYGGSLGVVLLDVDNLKETNDHHGHQAGDALLAEIARSCQALCRENDTFARIGGDEFGFVLAGMDEVGLTAFSRRLLISVRDISVPLNGHALPTRVSAGTALYHPTDGNLSQILWRADEAMYAVKREGGDNVRHG